MGAAATLFGLIGFMIVLGIFLTVVRSGMSMSTGSTSVQSSRRGVIQLTVASLIVAFIGPTTLNEISEGKQRISDVLRIESDETETVSGGTYSSVYWESGGQLAMSDGDSFTLTDTQ